MNIIDRLKHMIAVALNRPYKAIKETENEKRENKSRTTVQKEIISKELIRELEKLFSHAKSERGLFWLSQSKKLVETLGIEIFPFLASFIYDLLDKHDCSKSEPPREFFDDLGLFFSFIRRGISYKQNTNIYKAPEAVNVEQISMIISGIAQAYRACFDEEVNPNEIDKLVKKTYRKYIIYKK